MYYNDLQKGWNIEFRIIKDEAMQYMRTPTYKTKRQLNERLKELYNDPAVVRAEIYETRYFDKTL